MVLALGGRPEPPGRWSFTATCSVCDAADAEVTQEAGDVKR